MAGSPPGTKYLADANTFKGATDQIATLGSDLDITEGNVDTLETQVSNITTDITNIKNTLTSLNSTVGSQGVALNSVNGLITTAINAEVSSRNSAIVTAVGAEASRIDLVLTSYETTGAVSAKFTAEVSSRNTAISNALTAEATRVDLVLANYETKSGVDSKIITASTAEVSNRETAIANAMGAEATRVSTLLANYTTTSALGSALSSYSTITSRDTAIATAISSEVSRVDNLLSSFSVSGGVATGGGNFLSNSDIVTLDGWSLWNKPGGSDWGINLAGDNWHPVGENTLSMVQNETGGNFVEAVSDLFAVTPSSFIQFYAFVAAHRCQGWVSLLFFDTNGAYVDYAGDFATLVDGGGGKNPAAYEQIGKKFFKVPDTAVSARLSLRKYDTKNNQPNSYAWFWRPYVGASVDQQSLWNPYVAGSGKSVQIKTLASITSEATARTNAFGAEASRVDQLLANYTKISDVDTKVSAEATNRTTAIANAMGAEVTRIDQLLAGYSSNDSVDSKISAEVSSRNTAIANAMGSEVERVDTLLASFSASGGNAIGGGNYLTNTDFTTLDGWFITTQPGGSQWGINLAGDNWHPVGENTVSMSQTGTGGSYVEIASDSFPVKANSYIQFYAFAASHRSYSWVTLFFYDKDDHVITYAGENNATIKDNGGKDPSSYEQIGKKFFKVPAGAVYARMYLRKYDTLSGQADSYAWFWRPYVGASADQQSVWNPYVAGTAKAVQVKTNALIVGEQKARADAFSAEASRVDQLLTNYETVGNVNSKISAEATSRNTAISSALGAEATRVDKLVATFGINESTEFNAGGLKYWSESPSSGSPAISTDSQFGTVIAFDNASCVLAERGVFKQFFSTFNIPVQTNRRYRISTRVGAWNINNPSATSIVYVGFVGLDGQGNVLNHGDHGTYRYSAITGQAIPHGPELIPYEVIVTGEGNDSWLKFPPGTKQIKLMAILNYESARRGSSADIATYIDYIRFEDAEGEYQAGQASIAVNAEITNRNTAIANAMGAEVTRVSNLLASYTNNTNLDLRFSAAVTDRDSAIATATSSITTRQSNLEASAATISNSLNQNPKFSIWNDPTGLPLGWVWWPLSGYIERRIGPNGGYAVRLVVDLNVVNIGILQQNNRIVPGWYVIDADVELIEGSLTGSGVTAAGVAGINFSTDADINGLVSATAFKRRRFSKLIYVNAEVGNFHLMGNWESLGRDYKVIDCYYCGIRAATDPEVLAQKVNNDLYKTGGLVARIGTVETATTDGRFAAASRVSTLEATVNGSGGNPSLSSRISSVESVTNNGTFASASRVSVLEASSDVALNYNAYFKVPGYTSGIPVGWGGWAGQENILASNQPGRNGTIPVLMRRRQAETGLAVSVQNIPAGWYVLEAEVQLLSGVWLGSGMHVNFNNGTSYNIHFGSWPDTDSNVQSGAAYNRRTWSVIVHNPLQSDASFFAMAGWSGFVPGPYVGDSDTHWHKCVLRPATDGEIKAQKADGTLNNPGGLVSRIVAAENVINGGTFASASAFNTLSSSYNATAATVTTQAQTLVDLKGKTSAYWSTQAIAGNNRAQVTLFADNNNAGVDIVGDVRIHGSLTVDDSLGSTKFAPSSVLKVAFQTTTYDITIPHDGYANFPGDPGTGSVGSGGTGGGGGGGGGSCPEINELILLANDDKTGPGREVPAKDLEVGDYVWTQHEFTMEWGAYPVSVVRFVECINVWEARGFKASFDHPTWVDDHWESHCQQGTRVEGIFTVAFITVDEAHTYICAGVLSHNKEVVDQS